MKEEKLKQIINDMKGFKSPEDIWTNIEKDLPSGAMGAHMPFYRRKWPVVIAAVALLGLLTIVLIPDESTHSGQQREDQYIQNPSKSTTEQKFDLEQEQNEPAINTENQSGVNKDLTYHAPHNEPSSDLAELSQYEELVAVKRIDKSENLAASKDELIIRMNPLSGGLLFHGAKHGIKSLEKIDNNLQFLIADKYRPKVSSPDYTLSAFYSIGSETYRTQNNLPYQFRMDQGGFFISRHFSKFYIQTGLSLGYSRDKGERVIQYSRYEKIGEYQYVDSVAVDPITYQRSYFTITVDVFDSVSYTASNVLENRYQYLQLPIYLGYNLYSGNRYFAGVFVGGTFIKEISKQEVLVAFPYNGEISNTIPRRRDYNFQFSLGLTAGIKINSRWSFTIRPEIGTNLYNWYTGEEISPNSGVHSRLGFGLNYTF